jgi:hypothetical protein
MRVTRLRRHKCCRPRRITETDRFDNLYCGTSSPAIHRTPKIQFLPCVISWHQVNSWLPAIQCWRANNDTELPGD